jgi:hypothetical protein
MSVTQNACDKGGVLVVSEIKKKRRGVHNLWLRED